MIVAASAWQMPEALAQTEGADAVDDAKFTIRGAAHLGQHTVELDAIDTRAAVAWRIVAAVGRRPRSSRIVAEGGHDAGSICE